MNGVGTKSAAPCAHCHCRTDEDAPDFDRGGKPDPCLGVIPGVIHACCGHGNGAMAYVSFANAEPGCNAAEVETLRLGGREALKFFALIGVGPTVAKRKGAA